MSNFFKRVLILKNQKNDDSCILKIETGHGGYEINLRCDDKYYSDEYSLGIFGGEDFCLLKPLSSQICPLELSSQVVAGIFKDDELIFFGATSPYFERSFLIEKKKDRESLLSQFNSDFYNDELIATENYYDNQPISEDLGNYDKQPNRDAETQKTNQITQKENILRKETCEYAPSIDTCKIQNTFYEESAKGRLAELFSYCQEVTELKFVIPNSRFVKVNYTNTQSYIVGVIEENSKPKYICYGVDGIFGYPPNNLKDFCHFVPKSLFNLSREGYFMIFQSALTGEKITPQIDVFGF